MPDENNEPKVPAVDTTALTKKVESLTSQLEQAQAKVSSYEAKFGEFESSQRNVTTANAQLNEQMAQLKAQYDEAQKALQAKDGELVNWKTQFEQVQSQFGETTGKLTAAEQQLNLYKTIKDTPEYHGLIGMIDGIKIVDDPEAQKTILNGFANGLKSQVENSINMFRAGGTPASGTGGQPAQTGPKNVKEASYRLQEIIGRPGFESESNALQQYIYQANNNGNGGGPA